MPRSSSRHRERWRTGGHSTSLVDGTISRSRPTGSSAVLPAAWKPAAIVSATRRWARPRRSRKRTSRSTLRLALRPDAGGVAARGLADMPAERGTERARRAVADALGDFCDSEVVLAEQILRDGHAPGEQVLHRRQ